MGMYEQHYLKHWGVKGMKWGVRRYQNKDGSLTELGKKRMYSEMYDTEGKEDKERAKYTAEPHKWVGEDMKNEQDALNSASKVTRELKKMTDKSVEKAKSNKPKMDLSDMTDEEMRKEINRALLERQYNDMFAPQQSTKGRETVSEILEVAGSVLTIGATALGIAVSIGKLTGKL
jgi:hypothetical protein